MLIWLEGSLSPNALREQLTADPSFSHKLFSYLKEIISTSVTKNQMDHDLSNIQDIDNHARFQLFDFQNDDANITGIIKYASAMAEYEMTWKKIYETQKTEWKHEQVMNSSHPQTQPSPYQSMITPITWPQDLLPISTTTSSRIHILHEHPKAVDHEITSMITKWTIE